MFTGRRDRSGSISSHMSQTSSEADTSKDLSDLSDIEETAINKQPTKTTRRPVKKCVQRLFSPEIRTEQVIDPSSSPESLPEMTEIKEESPEAPRLPSVAEMMRTRLESFPQQTRDTAETIKSQKSKIWSISEIIGSASKTINTENTSSYVYSDYMAVQSEQTSSFDPAYYQTHMYQNFSNYYPSVTCQTGYSYDIPSQLNTSDSGLSTISDTKETIQFL